MTDPWGQRLDKNRQRKAGSAIVPGYICVLGGVQADQDYLRAVFSLKRYVTRQECCHLCAGQVLQWTSNKPGEPNDPNRLFTVFGAGSRASRRLFTTAILRPGPNKYPEPSPKIMNATAARFFLFWVSAT